MALSESALSELLVALTDRERGVDLVRELAEYLAQELTEVQATQAIGAGRRRTGEKDIGGLLDGWLEDVVVVSTCRTGRRRW
jgi:hypothetical protein